MGKFYGGRRTVFQVRPAIRHQPSAPKSLMTLEELEAEPVIEDKPKPRISRAIMSDRNRGKYWR